MKKQRVTLAQPSSGQLTHAQAAVVVAMGCTNPFEHVKTSAECMLKSARGSLDVGLRVLFLSAEFISRHGGENFCSPSDENVGGAFGVLASLYLDSMEHFAISLNDRDGLLRHVGACITAGTHERPPTEEELKNRKRYLAMG
jgi:hypothetical protein